MIFTHLPSSLTAITALLLVLSNIFIDVSAGKLNAPIGLTLTQWNQLRNSEAISDFMGNDTYFSAAMEFEWNEIVLGGDLDEHRYYTYMICNQEEGMSGSARMNETVAGIFKGKRAWYFPFYNQDNIMCLVAYMDGQDVIESYLELPSDETDNFRIQPMTQSMKMVNGTVDRIVEQMEQEPGVAIHATLSPGIMDYGNFERVEDAGKAILSFVKRKAPDADISSFFYESRYDKTTARTEFWSNSLQDGFLLGDNCKYMMDKMTIASVSSSNDMKTVEYGIGNLASKPVSERDQACVWSILQGLALHPAITSLEPRYESVPLEPTSAASVRTSFPRFGLGVISGLTMLQYFAQVV